MSYYPHPRALGTHLGTGKPSCIEHPGLMLDRYVFYTTDREHPLEDFGHFNQEDGQKPNLEFASKIFERDTLAGTMNPILHSEWPPARIYTDETQRAQFVWEQSTVWRLAIHLSRPSAMENAGVCLHPIYGFPLLPGQGLKGLARAYAKTEAQATDSEIERIFGEVSTTGAGTVIFYEAWPISWVKLELDILNNHHTEYYTEKGVGKPPGDWENPRLVYFLTVPKQTGFRFAVGPGPRGANPEADAAQAREWLQAALATLGAGAKTAAGYGYFEDLTAAAAQSNSGNAGQVGKAAQQQTSLPDDHELAQFIAEHRDDYDHSNDNHNKRLRELLADLEMQFVLDARSKLRAALGEKCKKKGFKKMIEGFDSQWRSVGIRIG